MEPQLHKVVSLDTVEDNVDLHINQSTNHMVVTMCYEDPITRHLDPSWSVIDLSSPFATVWKYDGGMLYSNL